MRTDDPLPFNPASIEAIIFDYGNTLVEFASSQINYCDAALADCLARLFGPLDRDRLKRLRHANRRAPYTHPFRENDIRDIVRQLVRELFHRDPAAVHVDQILTVWFDSFIEATEADPHLPALLQRLKARYRLGLLSNYPSGRAIRTSLQNIGLAGLFDTVVVSADVGHVKPHPLPFRHILRQLEVEPQQALFIGDNWFGDIQGAKRAGLYAVLIQQWDTPEKFDRQPGDLEPDRIIHHLDELSVLLGWPDDRPASIP